MTLTNTQIRFLEWLVAEGCNNPEAITFTRPFLKAVAVKNGMRAAPGWIVNDSKRKVTRGLYSVPELAHFIQNKQTTNV
jgi:hypothetical protein